MNEIKKCEKLKTANEKLEKNVELLKQERQVAEEIAIEFQQQLLEDQNNYRQQTDERISQLTKDKVS